MGEARFCANCGKARPGDGEPCPHCGDALPRAMTWPPQTGSAPPIVPGAATSGHAKFGRIGSPAPAPPPAPHSKIPSYVAQPSVPVVHATLPVVAPADTRVIGTIGDISVTPTTVITPVGVFPLKGTSWVVADNTFTTESIATAGIVLAIIFFAFCLLGLLFLLMKDRKVTGFVQVTVHGPGFMHTTNLPAGSGQWAQQTVSQIRTMVAVLG